MATTTLLSRTRPYGDPIAAPSVDVAPLRVLVTHSGKQHAYRHAAALQQLGMLERFITSSYYKPQQHPDRWLQHVPHLARQLQRRHLPGLESRVERHPTFELPEFLCRALIGNGRTANRLVWRRDMRFDRWVARNAVPRSRANTFWGFQASCCESLQAARACGMTSVVELATGHAPAAERILAHERERHPDWADSISNAGFPRDYADRLAREPHVADYCVVASTFSRRTLIEDGVAADKILTLPLGADLSRFTFATRPANGPFQILFVGGVGQRKGIKHLLDAYRRIAGRGVRLVVVGPMLGSGRAFRRDARDVTYIGRVDADDVVNYMHQSHVLVLPSLFEGFGLVIVEAMATGMPVIASTHSAAPDIIRDGRDGFVLEPDDVVGLADRLTRLIEHRATTTTMGREAADRAAAFGWDQHRERLREICKTIAST